MRDMPSLVALSTIRKEIETCVPKGRTKLVAIDGVGGSGKSTLIMKLRELCPQAKVLPMDHFAYTPREHPYHAVGVQTRVNLELIRDAALAPLIGGRPAEYRERSCATQDNPARLPCTVGSIGGLPF